MRQAAIGVRAHSGWAAVVAVAGNAASLEIVDRRRIAVIDPGMAGAKQPYHFAQQQSLRQAEHHLARCAAVAEQLACEAFAELSRHLEKRGYVAVGCAIVLASGRELPALDKILASHSLIHTAEGEFFRRAFRTAGEHLNIPVEGIPERQLEDRAERAFGTRKASVQQAIASAGALLGPPWTADQKSASLAAMLALSGVRP
jgi:hypothetical protein